MKEEGLKNIVLLKDLPSNLIEEAIIILKANKKIHKNQRVIEKAKQKNPAEKEMNTNYIINEAYMLIEDYTRELEKQTPKWKNNIKKLEKRYKNSIRLNIALLFLTLSGIIITIVNYF